MTPHLLILDDEPSLTMVISYMLQGMGWRVSVTNDPKEALTLLCTDGVDMFLTDYRMPQSNGLDVIEALRQSNPTMPVILMSGYALEIDRLVTERLGVFAILEKPFEQGHLVETLNRALTLLPPHSKSSMKQPPLKSPGGCSNAA